MLVTGNPASKIRTNLHPNGNNPSACRDRFVRTACFGACPDCEVTVYGDGAVFWRGGNYFVEYKGETTGRISIPQVNELIAELEAAGFFSMDDYTSRNATGGSKTVSHYYGDFYAPGKLFELECRIDKIVDTAQWIGGDEAFCRDFLPK